jgi:NADPH:quinone reductase-like Zn-dependent oxidoreductase
MPDTFRALIAEGDSKQYSVDFKDIPNDSLPAGEVLIQAMYSSLNYKDGLAITRHNPTTHLPGQNFFRKAPLLSKAARG